MYDNEVRTIKDADEKIKLWQHRISRGLKTRKKPMKRWKLNKAFEDLKQYGSAENPQAGGEDQVTVNKVGAFLRDHCAQIAFNRPRALVRPRNSDGWERVPIPVFNPDTGEQGFREIARYEVREHLLNYYLGHPRFGFSQCLRRIARAGQLTYGIGKVGYTAEFIDLPDDRDIAVPTDKDGLPDLSGFETETDQETGKEKLILDNDGKPIPKDIILSEEFFCDPVMAEHMIIDPDGGPDFFQHKWVAQIILTPLGEVQKNRNYKNTKDIGGTGWEWDGESDSWAERQTEATESDDPDLEKYTKIVRLFEIYDFVNERMLVMADGHDKFLRDDPMPEGIVHSPFAFFRPQEIDGEFYQRPPVSDLAPVNSLINLLANAELKAARRSAVNKTLGKKMLGDSVKAELESWEDTHSEIDDSQSLTDAIIPVPKQPFPAEMHAFGQKLNLWFDELGGQSGEARGVASSKTATQVKSLEMHANVRVEDQRNLLAACARELIQMLDDSIMANMSLNQAITIDGQDGQLFTANVSKEMIACDCDIDVDITEMAPLDPTARAAQFQQGFSMMVQGPWAVADPLLAETFLGEMGVKDRAVAKALAKAAQMFLQMTNPQQPQNGSMPEGQGPVPQNESEAISMQGGMQ